MRVFLRRCGGPGIGPLSTLSSISAMSSQLPMLGRVVNLELVGEALCPHRLACVRCPFYEPKDAEALDPGSRRQSHPPPARSLSDRGGASVIDGDLDAYRALRERNWEIPTPAGSTPRQLAAAGECIL